MATTTIRWDVTKLLVTLLRADSRLAGALVESGWPGEDNLRPDSIWVDELDGNYSYPFVQSGRKTRDDRFTIPFEIRVVNRNTLDDTMTRLAEIVAVIDDVIADDPTAGLFDGLMHCLVESVRMTCGSTPDGPVGFAEVVLAPFARYL